MRRRRGFTLVELMVVVTITGIIASVAVLSLRKSRTGGDVDAWANTVRNLVNQARRRAVATQSTYLLDLRQKQAQWCQATDATVVACPNGAANAENGGVIYAGADAITDSYAAAADIQLPGQSSYAAASRTSVGSTTTVPLYFGPSGTADTTFAGAQPGAVPNGATIYVRGSNATTSTSAQAQMHRKIVIYGISSRPRIIDTW